MGRPLSPEEKIALEVELAKGLVEYVRVEFGGDDEEAVLTAIEGETNLSEAIEATVDLIKHTEDHIETLEKRIQTLKDSVGVKKNRIERLRTSIRHAMEALSIKSMPTAYGTCTVKATQPKLGDLDEALIPSKYWTQPPPPAPVLDKKALLAALKLLKPETEDAKAETIPGATLIPAGTTLQIR